MRLPSARGTGVGCLGTAIGIVGFIATVCLLNDHEYLLAAVSVGVGLTFAAVLLWLDDGAFPNACENLGELANFAAAMNVKALRESGASYRRKDLWQAMRLILSERSGLAPEAIGRTTRFFPE